MMYNTNPLYWPALLILDVFGCMLFFWKRFKKPPQNPKKILVIRLDHIGDMIMTTPFFKSLKLNFPKAEIHVLCRTLTKPVIENNPNVSKIIEYNPFWFLRKEKFNFKKLMTTLSILRGEKYDMIFELHDDPRNIVLGSVLGGHLISYGKRGFGFLLNKKVKWKKIRMHTIQRNLDLLRALGVKKIAEKIELFPRKEKIPNIPKNFVIINPYSGRSEKDLTREEILEFVKITRKKNLEIVFTGNGGKEDEGIKKIQRELNFKTTNLVGKTNLNQLMVIVKKAKKNYTSDTAIVHIAKALNVPYECVYKTTDEFVWGYPK